MLSVSFYLFTTTTETLAGSSVGKRLLGLSVHPVKGEGLGGRVCLRNLDRLFWFALPPLNFAIGMAMRGDPRQTMLDHVAGTVVMHTGERQRYDMEAAGPKPIAVEKEEPEKPAGAVCQECGGTLIMLPNSKLQCEKCGLIQ